MPLWTPVCVRASVHACMSVRLSVSGVSASSEDVVPHVGGRRLFEAALQHVRAELRLLDYEDQTQQGRGGGSWNRGE